MAVPAAKTTVGAYLAYWLDTSARHRVRASTLESYANKVRLYVVPTLGAVPLQKLTPAHVQACYGALLKGDQGRG